MRILKLCTFPGGGATIAARRQKEALRRIGHDCDLACIHEDPNAVEIELSNIESEIAINVPPITWSYNGRITTAYCEKNRTDISNTWISFWQTTSFLDDALLSLCLQYDIIHLHWIAGMVSSRLLEELNAHSKRVFITGHDMNHFTGGCHYSAGCEQFTTGCMDCPQLLTDPLNLVAGSYRYKAMATATIPTPHWIFPSIWLSEEFRRSLLRTGTGSPNVLYNCIDADRFYYLSSENRNSLRIRIGFAEDEIVLVAGAADNTEKRKGFSYIEDAVQQLQHYLANKDDQRTSCVVVTFGRGRPWIKTHSPYLRHLHLGSLEEPDVIELFQAADLLLFPSIEENFSNTILESILCGCPVLAFNIGGVPDIVVHQLNGYIVESVSERSFSSALCDLVDLDIIRALRRSTESWRDQHAGRYSYEQIAAELISLYSRSTASIESTSSTLSLRQFPQIYSAIFGDNPGYNIRDHTLFAGNLARTVRPPLARPGQGRNRREIEAIYLGFGLEENPDFGRISWMKKQSFVFFAAQEGDIPALCVRISNINWIKETASRALPQLTAECNGTAATVKWLEADNMKAAFLWIVPKPESLLFESYNMISLSFRESSIPEANDSRGLCLLHNAASIFDLSKLEVQTQRDVLSDCGAANQLLIGADQSHYIHPQWPSSQNDKAVAVNTLEAWISVMKAFDVDMRSLA